MKRLNFLRAFYVFAAVLAFSLCLAGCYGASGSGALTGPSGGDSSFGNSSSGEGSPGPLSSGELPQNGLQVHFIDVGQGDSILIRQKDHSMLVDAGENDQGDVVVSYLKSQGIDQLDYVIGTHPHSDHIGGLDDVIQSFEVDRVFLPPIEHTTATFEEVLDAIEVKDLSLTLPQVGDVWELGEASFTILAPNKDYGDDLNNWSIGIRVEYGDNHFVLCGDAEAQAEADICANGLPLGADVLKAGHHGSSTSTSDLFLDQVAPSWVVIQCGKDNSYGHPHKETLEKLKGRGIGVLRTDLEGTLIAASDGEEISWYKAEGGFLSPSAGESPAAQEETYILNTNTKKFHRPHCASVSQMQEENRREYTGSREALMDEGYSPCGQCKP